VKSITLILLASGNSTRLNLPTKKQWLYIKNKPLWLKVAKDFEKIYKFNKIVIVGNKNELNLMKKFENYTFVEGSEISRAGSVKNALKEVDTKYVLVSDVARCCIDKKVVKRVIKARKKESCVAPALNISDTVYFKKSPIEREKLKAIQTPQISHTKTLKKILNKSINYTDESSAFYKNGKRVIFVKGSKKMIKLTYKEDLNQLKCLKKPNDTFKTGIGIDIHQFEKNKQMVLCGVKIDSTFGFKAHSDGDVAIHALIDALLGAASLGDIGEFFPDNDPKYKNIDSKELLKEVVKIINTVGYKIVNCDLTILAQVPKISPFKEQMTKSLSSLLKVPRNFINIKATTAENMGFVGRKEGILVQAVATLKYYNWKKEIK